MASIYFYESYRTLFCTDKNKKGRTTLSYKWYGQGCSRWLQDYYTIVVSY